MELLLACPLPASCCVALLLAGCGLVQVDDQGLGTPVYPIEPRYPLLGGRHTGRDADALSGAAVLELWVPVRSTCSACWEEGVPRLLSQQVQVGAQGTGFLYSCLEPGSGASADSLITLGGHSQSRAVSDKNRRLRAWRGAGPRTAFNY